jgi:hypothetical protein
LGVENWSLSLEFSVASVFCDVVGFKVFPEFKPFLKNRLASEPCPYLWSLGITAGNQLETDPDG